MTLLTFQSKPRRWHYGSAVEQGFVGTEAEWIAQLATDAELALKADKATTYTKIEVDASLATKANTSSLAPVATSGDYTDLTNKPTIPVITGKADITYVDSQDASVASTAQSNLTAHTSNTSNPHGVTKAQVGLGNVDNTSDANKPISTAAAAAIATLAPKVNPALTATTPAPVLTTVTTPALSGWTLTGSATYSAGTVTVGPAAGGLSTDIPVTSDTVYQIDLTTSASSGGDVTITLGAASATYPAAGITSVTVAATETGTRTLTIGGTTWSATITGVTVRALTRLSPAATIGAAEVRAWGANTGVGANAHRSLTSGANNTAMGANAQRSITIGQYNTAAGMNAQCLLTTGSFNAALGANAQYFLTSGGNNVAVGYGAQYFLTSGGSNVAVGRSAQYSPAGVTANATTTGARQTSIGMETGQSVSTQLNDITVLGYRARAGADFGTAIGSGAHAAHLRSVALGSTTTTTADDQVMVGARDVEITSATRGVILRSPSGTRYRVTVTDAGALTVTAV